MEKQLQIGTEKANEAIQAKIIEALTSDFNVWASWGVDPATIKPAMSGRGIGFVTNGFLHKGKVEVYRNLFGNRFNVRLYNDDGTLKQQEIEIPLEDLQRRVDFLVEYDPDHYEEMVKGDPLCSVMLNGGVVIYL